MSTKPSSLSRLDRVFTLLESGSSSVARKAAAKQLGDVQKKHPQELNHLLAKLLVYIQHTEWDTRIAASESIAAVVGEVPKWEPKPCQKDSQEPDFPIDESKLTFAKFDVDRVLTGSHLLLGSTGDEYMMPTTEGMTGEDIVTKQRKMLEKRLGLSLPGNASMGVTSKELFNDDDLLINESVIKIKEEAPSVKQTCKTMMSQLTTEGMSSRERNRAKRKAKLFMKQKSRDNSKPDPDQPSRKKIKEEENLGIPPDQIPEHNSSSDEWTEWPMEWISSNLMNLLLSSLWESRHGACIALRQIIIKHGGGCGKIRGMNYDELTDHHQSWLTDLAIRLLCVITLDRFADYISDQVVAPVRESCAQTLGVIAGHLHKDHIFDIVKVLLHLLTKPQWELRQGAMLCVQYIIAVKLDLQADLFKACFPSILSGLSDADGDVRNVSAKCLLPITDHLMTEGLALNKLLSVLWNSLSEYDELTASTQSVLLLLSKLIKSLPLNIICQGFEPRVLVLRLLPFFHHVLTCVKEAALSTMLVVIEASENARDWMTSVSSDATWNLLQCCLLETKSNTRDLSSKVFISFVRSCPTEAISSCFPYIPMWLNLAYYPESVPIPPTMLVQHTGMKNSDNLTEGHKKHIGGLASSSPSSDEHIMATRQCIACLIGAVCCHGNNNIEQPTQTTTNVENHLLLLMTSQSAFQRMVACIVVSQWWMESHLTGKTDSTPPATLFPAIFKILEETFYFSEISVQFIHVQTDMKAFLATLLNKKVDIENFPSKSSYSFHEVLDFCTTQVPSTLLNRDKDLREQRNLLMKLTDQALKVQFTLDSRVKAFAANAIVSAVHSSGQKDDNWKLPTKLNPIIRPLMESLKYEENVTVRNAVSSSVARLIGLCRSRQPCPNPKLVKNLCVAMISFTARCPTEESVEKEFSDAILSKCCITQASVSRVGILTILRRISDLQTEINNRKRKRNVAEDETANYIPESDQVNPATSSAGAVTCIQTIIKMHEDNLLEVVPTVWEILSTLQDDISLLSQSLLLLETVVPVIKGKKLKEKIFGLVPGVLRNLWHEHTSIRYLCSRCVAVLTNHMPNTIMPVVVDKILPQLDNNQNIIQHRGSIEALANIIEVMGTSVVPYAVLMVVPLLGCISDQDTQTRLLATQCFGQLVQYMPVESGIPDPPDLPEELIRQKQEDRRFLEQLFDNSSLDEYKIPVKINAKLRPYQEDGVKWLAFLNRYKLHGVLCDDMGLGKTLQTICILASDHFYQANKKQENEKFHSGKLISLVVCPPTLTGHWVAEVRQFCELLTPQHYAGNPTERLRLQGDVKKHNLVIASYEVVRNDIEFFSQIKWNYCVLDEGHAIKNGKSKLSQCIKSLYAKHRLILTGTPIQNSVLELWSLFDFLIPGLLGSESEFNAKYSKPIIASRDAKSSSVEQEEGLIAMESLHRQVLPFMLRRMKEDVLKDLPPKIIQDYYCELSPLQFQLYEDFAKSRAKKDAESSIKIIDEEKDQTNLMKGTSHVFQALQYLQKVCNHPLFVLTPSHPQYNAIMTQLKKSKTSLHDVKHASKLTALQQLLLDCGIGKTGDSLSEESVANQHRALVFCQHRNLLNIIENDLLRQLMPGVTYLRLDGGVPSNQRYSIVSKFNNDPSIDLLLLTTKVGGLGLNLTGADTVIFVEHDWNPMVDLQAMDRAHRIGQKKVVNVYRIITRGTMEEKILGLQEFKLNVANTIVGDDNRGIQSMGTNQVLDLFNVDQSTPKSHPHSNDATNPSKGLRAMMEGLGELWDQNQYDEEYNLDNFLHSLTK